MRKTHLVKKILMVFFVWGIFISIAWAAEKPAPTSGKGSEIFVQTGHSDNVESINFSPNGKYLASGSSG